MIFCDRSKCSTQTVCLNVKKNICRLVKFTNGRNGQKLTMIPALSCEYIIKDFVKMEDAEAETD